MGTFCNLIGHNLSHIVNLTISPDCRVSCDSVFMTKITVRHTIHLAHLDIRNSLELLQEKKGFAFSF